MGVVEAGFGAGLVDVAGLGGDGDAVVGVVEGVFVGRRGGRRRARLVAGTGRGDAEQKRGEEGAAKLEAARQRGEGRLDGERGAHATDYAPLAYALPGLCSPGLGFARIGLCPAYALEDGRRA